MAASAEFNFRIYYEDTDAGGVVYYANYLNFAERARTEYLRHLGFAQSALECFFVVRHAELDLRRPARLDDLLTVESSIGELGAASFRMEQVVRKGSEELATVRVKMACVGKDFRPTRIPDDIFVMMEKLCAP